MLLSPAKMTSLTKRILTAIPYLCMRAPTLVLWLAGTQSPVDGKTCEPVVMESLPSHDYLGSRGEYLRSLYVPRCGHLTLVLASSSTSFGIALG